MGQTVKLYTNKPFAHINNLMNNKAHQANPHTKPPLPKATLPEGFEQELRRLDMGKVKNIRQAMGAQMAARNLQKENSMPSIAKSFADGSVEKMMQDMKEMADKSVVKNVRRPASSYRSSTSHISSFSRVSFLSAVSKVTDLQPF